MCGIAGILSADKAQVSREQLGRMTTALAHRGPDGEGIWTSESGLAGFGHRRLSIIDLSPAGAQPMNYLDRFTIIHNGELYNHPELRNLLRTKGYTFSSQTDTEVIAAAYCHFGPDCLQYFDGMFAFAIWDESEKRLFLARDRFGEKPLFFYRDGTRLLFASEIKALWAAGIKKESNPKMLFNFLTIGYTQNPADGYETFYRNVSKLPPRTYLYYYPSGDRLETAAYWDIEVTQTRSIKEESAIDVFSGLLDTSVKRRLRSDVALGTSLSGGLDSSSLVACILRQRDAPAALPTFSAIFPGFEKDESSYIRLLGEHYPMETHAVSPSADDLIRDFQLLVHHQDEPFQSSSIYAQFCVFGLAASSSIKVMLDGQGADELLAGYHKYYRWYWQELYRSDRKAFALELDAARGAEDRWTWKNRLAARLPVYAGLYLKKKRTAEQRRSRDLSRDFVQQYGQSYYDIPHVDKLSGILYYNTLINGMEALLRYADRNAMAHGVEVRLPFLNHELAEFIFSLPSDFKIREGWTKWLLRRSMEDVLPAAIAWRKDKIGYETPQKKWMRDPRLQEYVREARRSLVKAGILNAKVLQKKIQPQDAHAAENLDWRYLVTAACI
ncbi:MAG TPA: asparagine synthase (glutamine-hydrolyzing) [Puia sp.]|nr:asparagine synthase (glutamine-hydrolyzing) [Puia sp.]